MNGYLGEELVTNLTGTEYVGFTPVKWALEFIGCYGQIDGEHHKAWVLDQVARILCGTPVIVKKATWGAGGNVTTVEYRASVAEEPSSEYVKWVAGQATGGGRLREGAVRSPEEAALEFMGVHGVHEQPDLYAKDVTATNWRLHALAQHKLWMLDQVARLLLGAPVIYRIEVGDPTAEYLAWVEEGKGEVDENGETEYGYEHGEPLPESKRVSAPYYEGIAP